MATTTEVGAPRRRRVATDHAPASALGDGAVLERLTRMRKACHALATELAQARRRLRAAEAELARLRQRQQ
jgi:hypothetical protein